MSATDIVVVNVSQTQAPAPSLLQKTGAILSQGGTVTSPGTMSLLTQPADLTPLIGSAHANTSLAYSGGTVTVTTAAPHNLPNGQSMLIVIAGVTAAGYNGTWLATVTGASAFTYATPSDPGSASVPGTWMLESVAEVQAAVDTFFGQGATQSVYVLELGAGSVNSGVAFLAAWIVANPNVFYSYLCPREWDGNSNFIALIALYESTTSKTYFYVTTTLQSYKNYTALMKDVKTYIESPPYGKWAANVIAAASYSTNVITFTTTTAHGVLPGQVFQIAGMTPAGYNGYWTALPGTTGTTLLAAVAADPGAESALGTLLASYYSNPAIPAIEFSAASDFFVNLNYAPSNVNKVTPNSFAFVFGVTPFPVPGNGAILSALDTAAINVIGTGAQGGISDALVAYGTTMDGRDFTYWYSVDWVQIQLALNLSNEIINGSNNPINPLYYDQNGINRLQKRAQQVMNNGITFGLVLGPVTVNAVPFADYVAANPGDFKNGIYKGLSVTYTPNRGFKQLVFNVNVSDFPTP